MSKQFHYVYKTVNLTNSRYYIGKHSTDNVNDGYLGSGKLLSKAINKYGKENFKKEILRYCNTEDEAYELEIEIITLYINDKKCYNIAIGGMGATRGRELSDETKEKIGLANTGKKFSDEHKEKLSVARIGKKHSKETIEKLNIANSRENNGFYGKTHSAETLEKMSLAKIGKKNGMFGRGHSDEAKVKISATFSKKVAQIDKVSGEIIAVFDSMKLAVESLGMKGANNISNCANGKLKTSGGYKWEKINK